VNRAVHVGFGVIDDVVDIATLDNAVSQVLLSLKLDTTGLRALGGTASRAASRWESDRQADEKHRGVRPFAAV
jgi:hypothetical protein